MDQKRIEVLMKRTQKALARLKVRDDDLRTGTKFIEKALKIHEKMAKKMGGDADVRIAGLCMTLAAEKPRAEESYTYMACYFFEHAYMFNNGDPRAIAMLKKHFGLLEVPDADGSPFYFYLSPSQLKVPPREPFEFQGKVYREVFTISDQSSDYYVTCTKSSDGEMTYQLVTDYTERDALHKRKWST